MFVSSEQCEVHISLLVKLYTGSLSMLALASASQIVALAQSDLQNVFKGFYPQLRPGAGPVHWPEFDSG